MSVKPIATQQKLKVRQGKVIGMTVVVGAEFDGQQFFAEAEWDVPEDRQVWSEEFTAEKMSYEFGQCIETTGLNMSLYEKIFKYKQEKEQAGS
jgi:hypothetical protein